MAAPPSTTVNSLSGQWTLNKTLSDDFSPILALQGINILIRKAAGAASVQLKIVQLDDLHITLVSTAGGGRIPGKKEEYTHDFMWRSEKDMMFGEMQIRSRWITVDEARSKGVVREADECWLEGGAEGSGELVYGEAKKEGKWEAAHLWGFEIVDGQRRHVRWVRVRNMKGEELRARLVYDFVSL